MSSDPDGEVDLLLDVTVPAPPAQATTTPRANPPGRASGAAARRGQPTGEAAGGPVAAVLVDSGLPHLDREFEYLIPESLLEQVHPGARVKVRFAGQSLGGYVIEILDHPQHEGRLAPVSSVVSSESVLTPEVLELARGLAARQAGSVMDVLRLAIPPRHARAEKALDERGLAPRVPRDQGAPAMPTAPAVPTESAETTPGVDGPGPDTATAAPDLPAPPVWAGYRAGAAWWRRVRAGESPRAAWLAAPCRPADVDWPVALAEAAQAAVTSGRGAIVVLPDLRDVDRVDAALTALAGPGQHVRLTADQGPQARYTAWLRVLRGEVPIVVGTRAAAYAPVPNLGLVAWWDDGDDLHQEPRAPYPHVRQVLTARAELEDAALLVGGLTMTAETAHRVGQGHLHVIGGAASRQQTPQVMVAGEGLDQERDGPGSRAHIPSRAHRAAAEALHHGPVLVQVPRRGYLPAMSCATCRAPARCTTCAGPITLPQAHGQPTCGWCGRDASTFSCPHCDGHRLRAGVIGARRTAEEIGRAFPGVPVVTSGGENVRASVGPSPAIVVSTPGAEPIADGGYRAVLLLDAWASLDRPDLRASEEALRRWMAAAALARPRAESGVVVLCGAPGHVTLPPVEALVRWDPQWFAGRELAERAELRLPPTQWTAQVSAQRARADAVVAGLRDAGGEVLGPMPVPGADDRVQLTVRAPWAASRPVAETLRTIRAAESARKDAHPTSVRVGGLTTTA